MKRKKEKNLIHYDLEKDKMETFLCYTIYEVCVRQLFYHAVE